MGKQCLSGGLCRSTWRQVAVCWACSEWLLGGGRHTPSPWHPSLLHGELSDGPVGNGGLSFRLRHSAPELCCHRPVKGN